MNFIGQVIISSHHFVQFWKSILVLLLSLVGFVSFLWAESVESIYLSFPFFFSILAGYNTYNSPSIDWHLCTTQCTTTLPSLHFSHNLFPLFFRERKIYLKKQLLKKNSLKEETKMLLLFHEHSSWKMRQINTKKLKLTTIFQTS